eukprot:m.193172 g.193172  ORF g.193172 m.193172 type:complete len:102 (-) comp53681_c0_seq1:32-337(-)
MVALTDSEHEQNRARIGSQTKPALREQVLQELALESLKDEDQAPAGSVVIRLDDELGARPAEPEFQEVVCLSLCSPAFLTIRQMAPAMNLALTDMDLELIE